MTKISTMPHVLNLDYIEKLHAAYRRDRNALPAEWRDYFDSTGNGDAWPSSDALPPQAPRSIFNPGSHPKKTSSSPAGSVWQDRINQLIRAYRMRGHIIAQVHPIGSSPPVPPEL